MRLVLVLTALLSASTCFAQTFSGKVIGIQDGDSLSILVDGKPTRVNLADIDAPELRQAFGDRAKQTLSDLCFDKQATGRAVSRDPYGLVARVSCDGKDASSEQVRLGMAWVYQRRRDTTSPLYFLEDTAQRTKEGLWADPSPLAPWRWRAMKANRSR